MVALLDAPAEPLGRRDREAHLDLTAAERARLLEARVAENSEHRRVLGQHFGDEPLDSGLAGPPCQLLEQPGGRAPPLEIVCDGERDLRRRRIAQACVLGERDDTLLTRCVHEQPDQCAAVGPIGL